MENKPEAEGQTKNEADFFASLKARLPEAGLEPSDLFLAKEISRFAGSATSSLHREALMVTILALIFCINEGSTRLAISHDNLPADFLNIFNLTLEQRQATAELLTWLREAEKGLARPPIASVAGKPGTYKPLIVENGWLYSQKLFVMENHLAKILQKKLGAKRAYKDFKNSSEAIKDVLERPCVSPSGAKTLLDAEQIKALETALQGELTVISGRTGSGKTSIATSLLRVLVRLGMKTEKMALVAPTGKAADRLQQSLSGQLAAIKNPGTADLELAQNPPLFSTIHRLLGYSKKVARFAHNEHNRLALDLVIVDESSMLDLFLASSLLRALKDDTLLILLGDADQLPAIEAGAVFRDLCQSRQASLNERIVVLKQSYRAREDNPAGASILALAAAINEGENLNTKKMAALLPPRYRIEELSFFGAEIFDSTSKAAKTKLYTCWLNKFVQDLPDLLQLVNRVYHFRATGFADEEMPFLKTLFAHFDKFRILCATREPYFDGSTEQVNMWFYRHWHKLLLNAEQSFYEPYFLTGEPVMMSSNDYRLGLYNGDSGLILKTETAREGLSSPPELVVVFFQKEHFIAYPLALLRGRLERAWATTVHKAQGSEYEHVMLQLPAQMMRPLSRELIYTAITRAKKSVLVSGERAVLTGGINRSSRRHSGLVERLS